MRSFLLRALAPLSVVYGSVAATSLAAQYSLSPTPVLPLDAFSREPVLAGYVSVRWTLRNDTTTFVVNRARITPQVLPARFAALRVQVDLSAVRR